MHCIHKKHPEFQALVNNSKMSVEDMSAHVMLWQEENNNLDTFPTLEELGLGKELKQSTPNYQKFTTNYNYPENGYISSKTDEYQLKQDVKRWFPELKVEKSKIGTYYLSRDGRFFNLNREFSQKSSSNSISSNKELETKLKGFLNEFGITVNDKVKQILTKHGVATDAIAIARLSQNVIDIVEDRADIETLPHETGHFIFALLPDGHSLKEQLIKSARENSLFEQVLNEYRNDSDYQIDGKPDLNLIAEETVGQLIGKEILNIFFNLKIKNTETLFGRLRRVISNKVKSFLNKFGSDFQIQLNEEESINPFRTVANTVFDSNGREVFSEITSDKELQAKVHTQQDVVSSLDIARSRVQVEDTKYRGSETVHHYKIMDSAGKLLRTIQMSASRLGKKVTHTKTKGISRTITQQLEDKFSRESGVMVHAWIQNIIDNMSARNPLIETATYRSLSDTDKVIYNQIKAQISVLIKHIKDTDKKAGLSEPVFRTEVPVYDKDFEYNDPDTGKQMKGVAGTIDLIVVHGNGSCSIYDWKTFYRSAELNTYKMVEDSHQLSIYKKILSKGNTEIGLPKIKEFRKTRLITFKVNHDKFKGIKSVVFNEVIPVASETTNNKKLDAKLSDMDNRLESMLASKPLKDPVKEEVRKQNIQNLRKLITSLRKNQAYDEMAKSAFVDLERAGKMLLNKDITALEVEEVGSIARMYMDINEFISPDSTQEFISQVNQLVGIAHGVYSNYTVIQDKLFKDVAEKEGVSNIFNIQRQIKKAGALITSIGEFTHPIIKTINSLIQISIEKTRIASDEFRVSNKEQITKLSKWASSKRLSLQQAYDLIINKEKGELIHKWNSEWWTKMYESRDKSDLTWLSNNVEIKSKELGEWVKKRKEGAEKAKYYGDKDLQEWKKQQALKGIEEWAELNSNLLTAQPGWIQPKSDKIKVWESKEWTRLNSVGYEGLKEFYEFFTSNTKDFSQGMPEFNYKPDFIPNIRAALLEDLIHSDLSAVGVIGKRMKDAITVNKNEDMTLGMFDEFGNQTKQIPTWHTEKIDPLHKSYDLGVVLQSYAEMSFNFRDMSEIEENVNLAVDVLKRQRAYETTATGKLKINEKSFAPSTSIEANEGYIEATNLFVDYYLYGISTQNPSQLTETMDKLNKYTAMKMLAFNPFSGIAASGANLLGLAITASSGRQFTQGQWLKAALLISGGSYLTGDKKKIAGIIQLLQPLIDMRKEIENNKLSSNIAVRNVDESILFAFMRKPDELMQMTVTLAMLQSHALVNNKLVKIDDIGKDSRPDNYYELSKDERIKIDTENTKKHAGVKSVWDSIIESNGVITIPGLDKLSIKETIEVRRTMQNVSKTIIGNTDKRDIYGYKMFATWRSVALFRNWMPKAYKVRFGRDGRYTTLANFVKLSVRDIRSGSKELKLLSIVGIEKAALISYARFIEENPDSEMTQNEFVDQYVGNMKMIATEITMVMGLIVLMFAGGKYIDDPNNKNNQNKYALKIAKRFYSELTMFWNPKELSTMLKRPVASIKTLEDAVTLIEHTFSEVYGNVTNDKKKVKNAKPLSHFLGFIPGDSFERSFRELNSDWKKFVEE